MRNAIVALIYIILLILMYLPLAIPDSWSGCLLYCYWTLIALSALILGWYITWRWSRQ